MAEENTQNINKEVNKEKNPERVEQGKKLAEWNRKNRKSALEAHPVQEEHAPKEPTQDVFAQKMLAHKYWIVGGALAIIGVLFFKS